MSRVRTLFVGGPLHDTVQDVLPNRRHHMHIDADPTPDLLPTNGIFTYISKGTFEYRLEDFVARERCPVRGEIEIFTRVYVYPPEKYRVIARDVCRALEKHQCPVRISTVANAINRPQKRRISFPGTPGVV